MDKVTNLIKNIFGAVVLIVMWVIYIPYAVCKALTDIEALKDFADDVLIAVGNIRFEVGKVFRRRSTHNAVISECMRNLRKQEKLKDTKGNLWLGIQRFLKEQYK